MILYMAHPFIYGSHAKDQSLEERKFLFLKHYRIDQELSRTKNRSLICLWWHIYAILLRVLSCWIQKARIVLYESHCANRITQMHKSVSHKYKKAISENCIESSWMQESHIREIWFSIYLVLILSLSHNIYDSHDTILVIWCMHRHSHSRLLHA
jgi:hypothetical protein